jgi:alpha-soluble NSF attachment protein
MADLGEAEKLLASAEEALQPKKSFLFFNNSPDYLEASERFVRAGNAFKGCREWRSAGDAFKRAADLDVRSGEVDESARKLLSAASCYKKCDAALAVEVIKQALDVLLRAGRFHLAAAQEKDIAELYETQLDDPNNAILYYERAAERYAGEDSSSIAQSCRLKAAALAALSGKDYEKAARLYEEAASESVVDALRKYSVRDFLLRAGICRLASEDRIAARRAIEGYPAIDSSFVGTRECALLNDVLTALEAEDGEAFTEAVSSFDRTSSLDDWKTRMLLAIKNNINEEPGLT